MSKDLRQNYSEWKTQAFAIHGQEGLDSDMDMRDVDQKPNSSEAKASAEEFAIDDVCRSILDLTSTW